MLDIKITKTTTPKAKPTDESKLGFGKLFSDHMFVMDYTEGQGALKYNEEIAAEYLKYFRKMAETFGLEDDIRVSTLGRCPEVLTMEDTDIDEEEIWA